MFNRYKKKLNKTYRNYIYQSIAVLEHKHVFLARVIYNELKTLVSKRFFNQYKLEESIQEVNLQEIYSIIEEAILIQVNLLRKLLLNKKISIDKDEETIDPPYKQDRLRKRIIDIIQIAIYSISLKKASIFSK